jgi:guanosine-3',5'-bis(diphosphate) 3'-pyrophosphohydrolase
LHRNLDSNRLAVRRGRTADTDPASAASEAAENQVGADRRRGASCATAHAGAYCPDGVTPYVAHVEDVVALVRRARLSDEVVCAAYLHDVCEHAGVAAGVIRARFGPVVALLVDALTQAGMAPDTGRRISWTSRRRGAVIEAAGALPDVVGLKSADLIANINQLVRGAHLVGEAVWDRYPAGGARQAGYYLALGAVLEQRLTEPTLATRLAESLTGLRHLVAEHHIEPRGRYNTGSKRPVKSVDGSSGDPRADA